MPWQRPLSVRPNPNEAQECPLISVCVREREGETGRERERERQVEEGSRTGAALYWSHMLVGSPAPVWFAL